jgi:hypothetical protein
VLKEKVKELEQRCNVLTVENETLKAEVEIYRSDAGVSGLTAGGGEGKGKGGTHHNEKRKYITSVTM